MGSSRRPRHWPLALAPGPTALRGLEHTNPLEGPLVRSNEVQDLLREGALVLTPLDQGGVGTTVPMFWYPMKTAATDPS